MRGWPGSCLLCHWQTGGPSLNVRTMGCWRIVCKGHGRAGRGPAPGSGTGDQGWVQDETSRQEDAAELESNRARPMAETITLHHSSAAGLDRLAWSGWRSPITGPAVRRSAQPRRGQVVCDPVLLDRRAAKLGSIRFNDNFDDSTWYWNLRNYSGSIFPASRSLRRRSCASGRRLETSAQYSAE